MIGVGTTLRAAILAQLKDAEGLLTTVAASLTREGKRRTRIVIAATDRRLLVALPAWPHATVTEIAYDEVSVIECTRRPDGVSLTLRTGAATYVIERCEDPGAVRILTEMVSFRLAAGTVTERVVTASEIEPSGDVVAARPIAAFMPTSGVLRVTPTI